MKVFNILLFFIFLNNLYGQFAERQLISRLPALQPNSYCLGDFDGDGLNDIVNTGAFGLNGSGIYNTQLLISFNNGDDTYGVQRVLHSEKVGCFSVKASDLDLDGDLDIIFSDYDFESTPFGPFPINAAIYWLENNGNGEFAERHFLFESNFGEYLDFIIGDLNNDSYPDIIIKKGTSTDYEDTDKFMLNDSNGGFDDAVGLIEDNSKTAVLCLDINNDGRDDIIFQGKSTINDSIYISYNSEDLNFNPEFRFIANYYGKIKAIDLNNDQNLDFVYEDGLIVYRLFETEESWTAEQQLVQFQIPENAADFIIDDLNEDNIKDLLIHTQNNLLLYILDSNAQIVSSDTSKITTNVIETLKINKNTGTNRVHIHSIDILKSKTFFITLENETFQSTYYVSGDFNGPISQFYDYDGDNDLDIIFGISWYENLGDGSFSQRKDFNVNLNHVNTGFEARIDDINDDGLNDIIYRINNGIIGFILLNEDSTYENFQIIDSFPLNYLLNYFIVKTSFNNNQNSFVCLTNDSLLVYDYLHEDNNYELTSSNEVQFPSTRGIKLFDYNLDGLNDFVSIKYEDGLKLFVHLNIGDGTFELEEILLSNNQQFINLKDWDVVDLDFDGDYEFLVLDQESGSDSPVHVTLFESTNSSFNETEIISFTSSSFDFIRASDIDSDGDPDMLILAKDSSPQFIYLENVNGSFNNLVTIEDDAPVFREVDIVDIDLDGDDDVFASEWLTSGTLHWYENLSSTSVNTNYSYKKEPVINAYPNPSIDGKFTINTKHRFLGNIEIRDLLGNIISYQIIEKSETRLLIDLGNCPNGVYFISYCLQNKKHISKIVKL